jgi:CheY-like chemotaxis protein/signal transduction histidine kinase
MTECSASLKHTSEGELSKHRERIYNSVHFMQSTLNSLVATYQILLMTINRCTDYTKTSHGIPLIPTLENIHLLETVTAPVACIKDLQNRITVELFVEKGISEFIITDRQWLQDNLLCLVSNGVKYSEDGNIKVRVLLSTSDASDKLNASSDVDMSKVQLRINSASVDYHELANLNGNSPENAGSDRLGGYAMLRFEVEDKGVGIEFFKDQKNFEDFSQAEVELMKKLFEEPDFTKRKELGGSGLGLHCLSKRVEALRGEFGVKPRTDNARGAIFWFSVPYVPAQSAEGKKKSSSNSKLSSSEHKTVTSQNPNARWFENEATVELAEHRQSNLGSVLNICSSPPLVETTPQSSSKKLGPFRPPSLLQVIVEEKMPEIVNLSPSLVVVSQEPEKKKPRILVVDDSLAIIKMLKMMLERSSYEVVTAVNGLEALQLFQRSFDEKGQSSDAADVEPQTKLVHCFEGILMDIQMPVMGGIESITKIRQMEKSLYPGQQLQRHHFIVAMSAGSDDEAMEAVFAAGADEFLPKPFNLQSFKKLLEEFHAREN